VGTGSLQVRSDNGCTVLQQSAMHKIRLVISKRGGVCHAGACLDDNSLLIRGSQQCGVYRVNQCTVRRPGQSMRPHQYFTLMNSSAKSSCSDSTCDTQAKTKPHYGYGEAWATVLGVACVPRSTRAEKPMICYFSAKLALPLGSRLYWPLLSRCQCVSHSYRCSGGPGSATRAAGHPECEQEYCGL
jgi:hypothetical protein